MRLEGRGIGVSDLEGVSLLEDPDCEDIFEVACALGRGWSRDIGS